jgi:hypothetical protein
VARVADVKVADTVATALFVNVTTMVGEDVPWGVAYVAWILVAGCVPVTSTMTLRDELSSTSEPLATATGSLEVPLPQLQRSTELRTDKKARWNMTEPGCGGS